MRQGAKILQWHHNQRDGIANHQRLDCLLNRLFKAQFKESITVPRHCPFWGVGPVNSPLNGPVTREMFPFEGVIMMFSWLICELRIRSVLHFDILCHVQYCAIPDQVRIMTKIICIRQYCTMTYGEPHQLLPFLCIKVTKISLASIGWLPFAGKHLQDWKPHCYIFESFAVTYIDIRAIIKNEQCPSHTFDTIWPTLKYSHARFCL